MKIVFLFFFFTAQQKFAKGAILWQGVPYFAANNLFTAVAQQYAGQKK